MLQIIAVTLHETGLGSWSRFVVGAVALFDAHLAMPLSDRWEMVSLPRSAVSNAESRFVGLDEKAPCRNYVCVRVKGPGCLGDLGPSFLEAPGASNCLLHMVT